MECCTHMMAGLRPGVLLTAPGGVASPSQGNWGQAVSTFHPGGLTRRSSSQNCALSSGNQHTVYVDGHISGCKVSSLEIGSLRCISGVSISAAGARDKCTRQRGKIEEAVRCQAASGSSSSVATDEAPTSKIDLPTNGDANGASGPILGSKPSYVPLEATPPTKGPQLVAKPQIIRPMPPPSPPTPPPNPPLSRTSPRLPTNGAPRFDPGRQFGRSEQGKPRPAGEKDPRPKFVFRQRENRPRSTLPVTTGGAAQSLREILEKAERMGENGNGIGGSSRPKDAATAVDPNQSRGFPWDLEGDGETRSNGSAVLAGGEGEEEESLFGPRRLSGDSGVGKEGEGTQAASSGEAENGDNGALKPGRSPRVRPDTPSPVAAVAPPQPPLQSQPFSLTPTPSPTPTPVPVRTVQEATTTLFTFDDEEEAVPAAAPIAEVEPPTADVPTLPIETEKDDKVTAEPTATTAVLESPPSGVPVQDSKLQIEKSVPESAPTEPSNSASVSAPAVAPASEPISAPVTDVPAPASAPVSAPVADLPVEVLRSKPLRPMAPPQAPRPAAPPVRPVAPPVRPSEPAATNSRPSLPSTSFRPSASTFRPSQQSSPRPLTPRVSAPGVPAVRSALPQTQPKQQLFTEADEDDEEIVVKAKPERTVPEKQVSVQVSESASSPVEDRVPSAEPEAEKDEIRATAAAPVEEEMPVIRPKPMPIERAPPVLRPRVSLQGPPVVRPPSRPVDAAGRPVVRAPRLSKPPEGTEGARLAERKVVNKDAEKKEPAPMNPLQALVAAEADKGQKKVKGDIKLRGKKQYGKSEETEGKVVLSRKQNRDKRKAARAEAAKANLPTKVEILEVGKGGMSVGELAGHLAVTEADVIKSLFIKGVITTVNQTLDEDTVRMVCKEYEVEVLEAGTVRVEDLAKRTLEFLDGEDAENLHLRPPVVTIMGHVDHGKTSLLDHIRKSKVAAGEAGGITQSIGAYRVMAKVGDEEQTCVFLDTPGHEAFSAMRARGTRVTDIAIVVVAGDDGVRPQSLEAIAHARAANVPIVVAINKMDKEGANAERVMQELAAHNLMPEAWGGDVPMVPVSALTGEGIDDLLENVMLLAEIQDLRANPEREAVGTVIEASLDKYRGPVATLLVQNGTLRQGDVVLCGEAYGKARALTDDTGLRAESAGPSVAVEVLGLSTVPVAGDEFRVVESLDEARQLAEETAAKMRMERLAMQAGEGKVTLASLASAVAAGQQTGSVEHYTINLVLKVDAQGSVEAVRGALAALPQDTVQLRFLLQAPGEVSSSDVDLALASQAIVLGFNVTAPPAVQAFADDRGVEVRSYQVIYDLVDDVRKAMEGKLQTMEERIPIGQADVRAVFGTGSSKVAGCMVTEGKLVKGCAISVRRGNKEVYSGTLDSLRRVKEMAKEVAAGLECGVGVDSFDDWAAGDVVEAFSLVEKSRTLEDASKENELALAASPF